MLPSYIQWLHFLENSEVVSQKLLQDSSNSIATIIMISYYDSVASMSQDVWLMLLFLHTIIPLVPIS